MPEIPKEIFMKKTTGFLALGIVLYLGSVYLNTLKDSVANFGQYLGILIIFIALIAQIKNWLIFWNKK